MTKPSKAALGILTAVFLAAVVLAPSVSAAKEEGSATAGCTGTSASADAVEGTPSASASMRGSTATDTQKNTGTNAHEDVTGDGGSDAQADNSYFRAHCSADMSSNCANIPTAASLGVVGIISNSDATSSVPVAQHTEYAGVISYIPALSSFWFFGTVNHNGIVAPFAAPVGSSGTLTLTPSTPPAMAPVAVAVIDCMPIGVGLDNIEI